MAKAAYIHIPFCSHKCDFCDFAAFAGVDELSEVYIAVLADEIKERLKQLPNEDKLTSVFYGGGTPGYIEPQLLSMVQEALSDSVGFADGCEITLETTPQSVTPTKARQWREIGINRISIGVQSFHDDELKAMGRDHTAAQAIQGIETAREAGFDNAALDLMYGLPEQTLDSWRQSLEKALSLNLPHMSAYGLTIANNSPLLTRFPRNSLSYPDEDAFVAMYKELIMQCEQAGLHQYEISNFSRTGFQSQHNLTYWNNDEYLAFGVSAHRYVGGVRSSNFRSLNRYMRESLGNETSERIDEQTRAKEAIFLGLRLRQGINLTDYVQRYGFDIEEFRSDKIRQLSEGGFLTLESGWLRLSDNGVLVSNLVLAELI